MAQEPTPLFLACTQGSLATVQQMVPILAAGLPSGVVKELIDGPDPCLDVTPLMALTFHPDEEVAVKIAQFLIERGANPDTPDSGPGATTVFMAAQEGKANLLAKFIEHGGIETPVVGNESH